MRIITWFIITIGFLGGACLALLSGKWPQGSVINVLLLTIGSGVISTALISLILDLFWSKERARVERGELEPFYEKTKQFANQLEKLEGRLEAFKHLGLNYCHAARSEALRRFLGYAREIVTNSSVKRDSADDITNRKQTINIVSSSARGLIGYLDREPQRIQREWRDLIMANPSCFRILLTHPAYAHLRQPAEERSAGDIELEILKTSIYLHCVARMKADNLRFYRGSPTVFAIQAEKHMLLNPYPYGKMAMETLCLEFESEREPAYVADFVSMHFNHTWAFIDQPSKQVDGKPLVAGVESFQDIITAFLECTHLGSPKRLRLTESQVIELDTFVANLTYRHSQKPNNLPDKNPFLTRVINEGFTFGDRFLEQSEVPPHLVTSERTDV